ncbi:MAG: glycosyltransferase [Chloroflexi bacterium]|nr:glycosyltransferase [Chloroflexota bacterium]
MWPRRILYVDLAPAVGGSIISLYQLVKGLDRERYAPWVILRAGNPYESRFRQLGVPVMTIGGPSEAEGLARAPRVDPPRGERWAGLRHSRLASWLKRASFGERLVHGVGFLLRTWPDLRREAHELYGHIRAIRPDLMHLNDVVCVSRAGIMAARRARVPAICHLRAMAWRTAFDRRISRYLCGYICISQAVDAHQRGLGGRTGPSWIVYNGLDLAEFSTLPSSAEARAAWGLGPQDQVVGCVGRLVAWKGQEVFIRALAMLSADFPRLRGLIVGGPEAGSRGYAQGLQTLAEELGLRERVTFTGFRADVLRLLPAMDVLAHTSTAPEPFGRVLIEGMAAGVAVIGASAGAVPEIIKDGVTGRTVPPGDSRALAEALAYALEHPGERERWCRAAREVVERRFTTDAYVQGVQRVYEELLT